MKIAFNPSTVAALITPPNNKDITFDLRGRNIFARGVKFLGTDTWRDIKINNVSISSNILDLRNGSNTTLTNTNGVVTINSTWRPVVDNLTSDSTTSSLSAKQGKVLKALIDGKSNSGHTHDDRYVKKSGDTMSGVLTIDTTNFGALTIKRNDDANGASIQFRGKSSVYGYIGLNNSTKDKQFLRWGSDTSKTYTILDTSSTYTSNGKGIINGTTITQVDNATNSGNADTVDGVHLNGIFTAFLANGNATRLVIGGVTKDLTISYASLSPFLCKNSTFNSTGLAGLQYYDGDMSNTTNNNSWSVPSSGWHLILHLPLSVSGYFTELSFPVNDVNGLAWRQRRSSSYYGWYRILDSNNYSSYVKKIGTSTVGSSSIPIYLNAGTPTLCSTTLGVSITGNAATATKLTSSAGNAALPIYFSDGKPVACTASSIFSNLSNSGNNLSITVAGQNRTLTVGYATSADYANGIANKGRLNSQEKIDNFITANRFEYTTFKTTESNNVGFASNDGMILSIPFDSTAYGAQMAFDDTLLGTVKVRGKNTSWGNWHTLLHSGNYNSYSPTLTGAGASGTWGINISGNADTTDGVHIKWAGVLESTSHLVAWESDGSALRDINPANVTVGNSDKLDGYHATNGNNKPWGTIPVITAGGYMDIGKHLEFHFDNTTGSDYSTILRCTGNYANIVNLPSASGTLALKSEIPTSLKNPYSLTLLANGTTLATYDGSVSKIVNLTYDNVGAAAKNHTHNSLEPWASYSYITGDSHATALKSIFDKNKTSIPRNKFISMFSSAYGNGSCYMGYFLSGYENNPYGGFFVAHYDTAYYIGISNGSFTLHRLVYSTDIPNSLKNPHALTISLNGTSLGSYDGSAAKSINITPSSIGAATSEHNHDNRYLKLTGGNISGTVSIRKDLSGNLNDWILKLHNGPLEVGRASNTMCVAIGVTDDNYGYIQTKGLGITTPGNLVLLPGGGNLYKGNINNVIWHAGNDGANSGLDADLLDGNHASAFATVGHTHLYVATTSFNGLVEGTVATYKNNIHNALSDMTGIGKHIVVSDSIINNWSNDSASYTSSSVSSIISINGGYNGRTFGQFLVASWNLGLGLLQYNNGSFQNIKWFSTTDHTHSYLPLSGGTMSNTNKVTNLNADLLDGYNANGLLTALSNSNNGISITVGGTTKSISNISVNYASSAGSATAVIVHLNTTTDANYPLVWSNLSNTNNVTENQLYKSWSDLYYNPKNKRLTVGGSVVASSFVKSGGTSLQLLRADGGIATFNWSGQSGLPTWLWGGNNLHSYYVYNPSNFRVAYASSAGNADYIRSNALPTPANNTVKAYKDSLAKFFNDICPNAGVGANVNVSESIISHWSNDSATFYNSSNYCFIKIGGAYTGSTYGQFLLSSYNLSKVGIVGRNSSLWSKIKWLAYEDQIPTDNKQLANGAGYITSAGSCAYATSSGNADTVDGYHASSLVKFYLSPMTSNAPADSAKSWFVNTMPSASAAIVYNVPGSEKTIIAGKSSGALGHMLQLNYDDTYLRILRYYSGSWKSTDWEKISAGYADSAGSVAWSNVTGKPSSLKNPYSLNVFGVTYDGSAAKTVTTSTFVSLLSEGTSTVTDGTMFITSWASDSGFADTNAVNVPYKRKASCLWDYIKAKTDTLYSSKSHTHSYLPLAGGTMNANARIGHGSGNLYIGSADNNGWVMTQDIASQSGTDKWYIKTSGASCFGTIHIASKTDGSFNSNVIECNSTINLNYFSSLNVSLCNGGGTVQIGSYTTGDTGNNKLYVNGSEFINGASNVKDHVFANGFRHRSHNSDDAVLLAGGGYSQGVPVRYWAIYYMYIGNSSTDVTYTKRGGNYDFITSEAWESEGSARFDIRFPSGYNKNNTLIFGNGNHRTSSSWKTPVYVTITTSADFGTESQIRVMISDDASLNVGFANIYFMCMG